MKKYRFTNHKMLHPLDYERFKILSKDFVEINTFNSEIILKKSIFFTTELIFLSQIVSLFFNQLIFNSKINLLIIEIYNVSFKSYFSELIFHKRKVSFFKKFLINPIPLIKIFFFKLILSNKRTKIIITSNLRSNLLNSKKTVQIVKNFPTKQWVNIENNLRSNFKKYFSIKYIFLPGRINNVNDLSAVKTFAQKNNLKIIICGSHHDASSDETIKYIGNLNSKEINLFIKNCLFGLVLYNNETLSQTFSSSSKLFEFLIYSKPLFYSDNLGVIDELNYYKIKNAFIINNNLKNLAISFNSSNLQIDKRFIYENQFKS
jgi:hypothetical protein